VKSLKCDLTNTSIASFQDHATSQFSEDQQTYSDRSGDGNMEGQARRIVNGPAIGRFGQVRDVRDGEGGEQETRLPVRDGCVVGEVTIGFGGVRGSIVRFPLNCFLVCLHQAGNGQ
jgi:hypothetical protein